MLVSVSYLVFVSVFFYKQALKKLDQTNFLFKVKWVRWVNYEVGEVGEL